MLTVLDLFSGIGGFSLGLERTGGFKTIAFCEIDPFCRKVLAKHWPGVPIYEDVAATSFPRGFADVVCGGFPCQDVSEAASNRAAGLAGDRSGLWDHLQRIIGEVRPSFAIVENVSNLLAGERGNWFGRILRELTALGYDAEWHCIPAAGVGAPHIRDRVWIVAYPNQKPVGQLWWGWRAAKGEKDRPLHWTEAEPRIDRVVDGVPNRVDRVGALGNAVVPQIPELIGRAILQAEGLKQ